jgi:glycosyltransferase involved in cell wall biosynthesis
MDKELHASAHNGLRDSIRHVTVRILIDYRPALRERTGVGEYVHQSVAALARSAPDESLSIFSASWKDRLQPIDGAAVLGLVDRRIPVRLLHLLWHRLEWPSVEQVSDASYDVVQSGHPLLIPSRKAARLVTIYDLDFLDHPERTAREIRRDYPSLARTHAARADQVIVISEHTARTVESRLGIERARISICTPGAPNWTARSAEPASRGVILFLGTLEPRKNLETLVDAYGRLVAIRPGAPDLVLAGRITDAARPLVERVSRAPFAGRVQLPGYIAPDAREALYHRAIVFVLPSHTEGFGMPVVEAMMAGVPVIAANRGALPEAVGPAGILVDPDDAEALTQTLQAVLDDRVRRQTMTEAGRRHAATFTWARTAGAMREAWNLALEHQRSRRG